MFSFFKKPVPSNSFDACSEFKKIRPLILLLFDKETELKNSAQTDTVSHRKHEIISELCETIRQLQIDFNQATTNHDAVTQNQSIALFANKLLPIITDLLLDDGYLLNKHRDVKKRNVAKYAIDIGAHAAMIIPPAALGSPVIATVMAAGSISGTTSFITKPIRRNLYYATGLVGKQAKSYELLHNLSLELQKITKEFKLESNNLINETENVTNNVVGKFE